MTDYRHYIDHAIASMPIVQHGWVDRDAFRSDLASEFRETIAARAESRERASQYAAMCPVNGAVPSDYHLREIVLFDDFPVLAGIHFRNLDVGFPFVGVYAQSRSAAPDEVIAASKRLAGQFSLFNPRCIRWWSPADRFDLREIPGAIGDQRLIVGSIPDILATPMPATSLRSIRLEPESEEEGYDRYRDAFNEFLESNPAWKNRLPKTDRDDFRECENVGGLYRLLVGQEYAGMIAARPGQLMGIRGWEMMEELIVPPFRGSGLASTMQRLFIERLDTARASLVFGTIDDRNVASMKTALRVGRRDVGGWVFIQVS